MAVHTNAQKMAQVAYERAHNRGADKEFASFARSFPSLIHACGLAQALAFANAKDKHDYLDDLAAVLAAARQVDAKAGSMGLQNAAREHGTVAYMRLSRSALQAAGWLKRYTEAVSGS